MCFLRNNFQEHRRQNAHLGQAARTRVAGRALLAADSRICQKKICNHTSVSLEIAKKNQTVVYGKKMPWRDKKNGPLWRGHCRLHGYGKKGDANFTVCAAGSRNQAANHPWKGIQSVEPSEIKSDGSLSSNGKGTLVREEERRKKRDLLQTQTSRWVEIRGAVLGPKVPQLF